MLRLCNLCIIFSSNRFHSFIFELCIILIYTLKMFTCEAGPVQSLAVFILPLGYLVSGTLLLQACGSTIPTPVTTSDNYGYVRFRSNERSQIAGSFSLNFEASIEGNYMYYSSSLTYTLIGIYWLKNTVKPQLFEVPGTTGILLNNR